MANCLYSALLPMAPPRASHHTKGLSIIGGKARMFDKKALRQAKANYAEQLMRHRIPKPINEAVLLVVWYEFPHLKTTSKTKSKDQAWKFTKPDLSNMNKTLEDSLTKAGILHDDALVVACHSYKVWGPTPCVRIAVYAVPPVCEADWLTSFLDTATLSYGGNGESVP